MNSVVLIGNLTQDPELRTTQTGVSVCRFSIAVNRVRRKEGEPEADFVGIVAWRQQAEACGQYLSRGHKICVQGSLRTSAYTDAHGIRRYGFEIEAQSVEFLGAPRGEVAR